jgi:hypothetical protein
MFDDFKDSFLKEFVDAKGNKVTLPRSTNTSSTATSSQPASKTNKEKFEELVIYMKYYQVPYTTKMEVARLNDLGFKYIISRKPVGVKEYTITLDVHYSRFIDSWQFTVYKNDDYLDDASGKGWAELLKALRNSEFGTYAIIPKPGSVEYDYLCESASLKEFVDKNGNKVNLPKASSSAPVVSKTSNTSSNKDKFIKLIYTMMRDKIVSATHVECVRVDDYGFTYKEVRDTEKTGEYTLTLLVGYNKDDSWKYELYIDTSLAESRQGDGMKELINFLSSYFSVPAFGTTEYKELCESATSFADDFKLYENLWD